MFDFLGSIGKYLQAGFDIVTGIIAASKDGKITTEEIINIVGKLMTDLNITVTDNNDTANQDEINSIKSNKEGYLKTFGVELPDNTVRYILAPGWLLKENGTQLWNRMLNYHNSLK